MKKSVTAVVVAAGNSTRMGFDKLFAKIDGKEVLYMSINAMMNHPDINDIVVVAGKNKADVEKMLKSYPMQKPVTVVSGGATRTASVVAGVSACPSAHMVAIHDGARPFVSQKVITDAIDAAKKHGAAAPALPMKDTIKRAKDGFVCQTMDREDVFRIQTPQVFDRTLFLEALKKEKHIESGNITDDCMIMENAGHAVYLSMGEETNRKITTVDDLPQNGGKNTMMRIGHGYDVHRLTEERKLILGGVEIPYEKGLLGHSDADVLVHAVMDGMLGALALGDIGKHFPDTDGEYHNADSIKLLEKVTTICEENGYIVGNLDATLLCQAPKLAPHIQTMRKNIAQAVNTQEENVSVKATTEEGLGFTGAKEGIAAHCVVVMKQK